MLLIVLFIICVSGLNCDQVYDECVKLKTDSIFSVIYYKVYELFEKDTCLELYKGCKYVRVK